MGNKIANIMFGAAVATLAIVLGFMLAGLFIINAMVLYVPADTSTAQNLTIQTKPVDEVLNPVYQEDDLSPAMILQPTDQRHPQVTQHYMFLQPTEQP